MLIVVRVGRFDLILFFFLFYLQTTKIKHSTPDKVSQRNSNADDDIFFDMDGLDTRDSNMPQMTQSDDEDVDDDEDFGMSEQMDGEWSPSRFY